MNKTAIKNFSIWARNKLISDISYQAGLMGIREDGIRDPLPQSNSTTEFYDIGTDSPFILSGIPVEQRKHLADLIRKKAAESDYATAYKYVIEEAAYTWFNRLIAIRFMEVNDYLPGHVRVLSSETGKMEPDLVTNPFDSDLTFTLAEKQMIQRLKEENLVDGLFQMLFIKQCNALNDVLPGLFEKTHDYTELILNLRITDPDGVVTHLVHDIPEDDFNVEKGGQVEIIGWLYQFYNTEPKADVFAGLKRNIKITKDTIPAATQLFTPDWIVRYMVENSLGRLWVEHLTAEKESEIQSYRNGKDEALNLDTSETISSEIQLKQEWKYYLDDAIQEPDLEAQLRKIRKTRLDLKPEDIRLIDPCMGSGHILVYAFDVLMQIYLQAGWTEREAAQSILKKNLYGIDIDKRAAQIGYFALIMKGRQYDRRILTRDIQPNICSIVESNGLSTFEVPKDQPSFSEQAVLTANYLIQVFRDAREYGSIINVGIFDYDHLIDELEAWSHNNNDLLVNSWYEQVKSVLPALVRQAIILSQKYDVIVTNPPYMGDSGMSPKLSDFVKQNYPETKTDMSTVFMEKNLSLCKQYGFVSMINIPVWMSISSYEKFRKILLQNNEILNMLHFGRGVFGADFGSTSFIVEKAYLKGYIGTYLRLFTKPSIVDTIDTKEKWFLERKGIYEYKQDLSFRIPGQPIAYWFSEQFVNSFKYPSLNSMAEPKQGLATADNNRFLRLWFECDQHNICYEADSIETSVKSGKKWFPYNKGGEFRKWYGNNDYVVNWENDGYEIRHFVDEKGKLRSRPQNTSFYFHESITWSKVTIGNIAFRYKPEGHIFDVAGTSIFTDHDRLLYLLGFCNSKTALEIATLFSPSMNYEVGHIAKFPIIIDKSKEEKILELVETNIDISKRDWDTFETSWDFKGNILVWWSKGLWDVTCTMASLHHYFGREQKFNSPLELCWLLWKGSSQEQFDNLKSNEEELNRLFIDIYGLHNELTPEVVDDDIKVRKADVKRDICSLISYAVGCMFGRYSLDQEGLIFAGGNFDEIYSKKKEYLAIDFQNPFEEPGEEYICLNLGGYHTQLTYSPDKDNVLPICDEEYFSDDIVGRFVKWIEVVFGEDKLEANLQFIADALGGSGSAREVIRHYFLNDFYKDHCSTYSVTGSGKRPIYWLFDSGKENGFKALIYLHRYTPDTIGTLRVDYLHKLQRIYESEIGRMQDTIDHSGNNREIVQATKQKEKLQKQLKECRDYDEKLAHLALSRIELDLDDGVKVNYRKLQTANDGKLYEVLADSKNIMSKA